MIYHSLYYLYLTTRPCNKYRGWISHFLRFDQNNLGTRFDIYWEKYAYEDTGISTLVTNRGHIDHALLSFSSPYLSIQIQVCCLKPKISAASWIITHTQYDSYIVLTIVWRERSKTIHCTLFPAETDTAGEGWSGISSNMQSICARNTTLVNFITVHSTCTCFTFIWTKVSTETRTSSTIILENVKKKRNVCKHSTRT